MYGPRAFVMDDTTLDRRQFVAALAGIPVLAACHRVQGPPAAAAARPPADEWERVRAEFALAPDWVHLAGFLLASHPTRVREAIERHRRALDDNPALYLEQKMSDAGPVLKPAAAYMGVEPGEIALTDSTTMGLALLYGGLPLRAGDEVLTTEHDHYATHESLRLTALRSGAVLRKVALYTRASQATVEGMAHAIERAITPATRVVAITWVHSGTGVRTPVPAIADVVARANGGRSSEERILLCVDGVHGFGVEDVTMADLGCDFFVAGTHKWLFGPRGTCVIWGRAELWPLLRQTIPHLGCAAYDAWMKGVTPPPTTADMMTPGGFQSFEHRWALGEAFEFHRELGKAKIAARIHELNRQCKQGLAAMKHVTLHTPMGDATSAGIVTFEVAGLEPEAVVKRLHDKRIVASSTPYAVSYARLAAGVFNSAADVEVALREIRALA
jgi:selenocysteine lyase/cysteine desulfurase